MNRPLRVLSLSTLFPDINRPNFGIFVERSLEALAAQPGVDVTVVAPVGMPPWPLSGLGRYAPSRGLPLSETWHGLTVRRPRWRLFPGAAAATNGIRVADAVLADVGDLPPFDVINAHFFHPDAVAAQQLGASLGIPYSVIARGTDIAMWAGRSDTGPGIVHAASGAGGLLAVSAAIRDQMIGLGFPADRIAVHHTGVDSDQFRPLDRHIARRTLGLGDGPVLLTVGTLNSNKGQHLVIDALTQIPGATYLVAGLGPDAESLRSLAQSNGLADRVQFLGSVPHADLPTLYNAADISVQPSANEGLANVWVEAMACGTPVIAADIPPAHEAIDPPHGGCVVERTPLTIANAVQNVLAVPPDRASLAQRTHARFSWHRHGAAMVAHLRQIAGWTDGDGSGGGT